MTNIKHSFYLIQLSTLCRATWHMWSKDNSIIVVIRTVNIYWNLLYVRTIFSHSHVVLNGFHFVPIISMKLALWWCWFCSCGNWRTENLSNLNQWVWGSNLTQAELFHSPTFPYNGRKTLGSKISTLLYVLQQFTREDISDYGVNSDYGEELRIWSQEDAASNLHSARRVRYLASVNSLSSVKDIMSLIVLFWGLTEIIHVSG